MSFLSEAWALLTETPIERRLREEQGRVVSKTKPKTKPKQTRPSAQDEADAEAAQRRYDRKQVMRELAHIESGKATQDEIEDYRDYGRERTPKDVMERRERALNKRK